MIQPAIIDFDVFRDEGLHADAHARLAELREASPPVVWTPRNGGHWVVFDREALETVLTDTDRFSSSRLSVSPDAPSVPMIPLSLDPPAHAPYRNLLLSHLGPKEVRKLEPFVRAWAERLIAPLASRTSCEFIGDVAAPLPVSVFMDMMGLPLERRDEFRGYALTAISSGDDAARGAAHQQIVMALAQLIGERRASPKDDLISALVFDEIDGRPLADHELMSICFLLFLAGLDTVTNAMAFGMRHLAGDPDLQARIRADRSQIPAMVERLLKLYTFVNTVRVATGDTELAGTPVKAGDALMCVLWTGSVAQEGARHMAFGFGPHTCLGMHLARLELKALYETWLDTIGSVALAPDQTFAMHGGNVMGLKRLDLVLS
ncbi:MAG: hypothetical protein JWP35_1257 [Caulobacter sp.]|nr:hypothetical protein [Caulobacter sp.]